MTLPKIALIADVENWAFHNISNQIVRYLSDDYDFKIYFYGHYEKIEDLMFEVQDFDLIHFFWRDALFSFLSPWVRHSFAEKGLDYEDFLLNTVATANITTSASEHLLISETEAPERVILYNVLANGYTTFSEKLYQTLSAIPNYPQPFSSTEDGVDLDFFYPVNPQRFYREKDEILVGWVGNSKWGAGNGIDHKGIETIIKPVVESLREEGYNVCGHYADRHEKWTPYSEMPDYYNSIDIYVCASDIEGTPNPVMEAMACGIPIISTDVGIVPNIFGAKQKEYILLERTKKDLREKLIELIESPPKRAALSKENLESIKHWSWEKQTKKWGGFFKAMLVLSRNPQIKEHRDFLRQHALKAYLTAKAHSENKTENNAANDLESLFGNDDNTELTGQYRKLKNQYEELKEQNKELKEFAGRLQHKINLMEQSEFWKLRNEWFKFKHKLGISKDKY